RRSRRWSVAPRGTLPAPSSRAGWRSTPTIGPVPPLLLNASCFMLHPPKHLGARRTPVKRRCAEWPKPGSGRLTSPGYLLQLPGVVFGHACVCRGDTGASGVGPRVLWHTPGLGGAGANIRLEAEGGPHMDDQFRSQGRERTELRREPVTGETEQS